jgi:hypothetical protein
VGRHGAEQGRVQRAQQHLGRPRRERAAAHRQHHLGHAAEDVGLGGVDALERRGRGLGLRHRHGATGGKAHGGTGKGHEVAA